jgi:cytoskeletal protein RodZ
MTSDRDFENAVRPAGETAKPASLELKALREARGLTLREIYERTRVTVVNLEAIETERFHLLPSPAYAKTFINAYADAVGIDSKIIFGAYDHYLQSLNVGNEQEKDNGRYRGKGNRKRLLIGTALLIIIAGLAMMALFVQCGSDLDILRSEPAKPAVQKTDAATTEAGKPAQAPVQTERTDQARPEMKTEGAQLMTGQSPAQPGRELQTGVAAPPGQPVSSENRQTAAPR